MMPLLGPETARVTRHYRSNLYNETAKMLATNSMNMVVELHAKRLKIWFVVKVCPNKLLQNYEPQCFNILATLQEVHCYSHGY